MMRRMIYLFAMIVIYFGIFNSKAEATSWVELEAEEVSDRAEVIVLGTYKIKEKKSFGLSNFQRMDFKVNRVYRGKVSGTISAGIDVYDTGWAEDLQDEGGEFLLFLEKGKQESFLIPVGGPNGMIHVKDGKVIDVSEEKKAVYEAVLQGDSQVPNLETPITFIKRIGFNTIVIIGALLLVSGVVVKRLLRKR